MFKKHIFEIMWLKINDKSNIQLSSGQVIRDCVLVVVYIGNPIIGTSVLYVEQVENIQPEPNVLEIAEESAIHDCIRSSGKLVVTENKAGTVNIHPIAYVVQADTERKM